MHASLALADLRWAHLREADLTDIDLVGAHLEGVEMWKTVLEGARINHEALRYVEPHLSTRQLASLIPYSRGDLPG